ncbi:MAG: RagB/SusD family nutrient uptake outer membrane protein [Cytophagaceae bacterium]|nr:RagB/SusD family nutrient uptake outer membrane protein [Cytophagaceae bacterium]
MNKGFKYWISAGVVAGALTIQSCTDLTEQVYDTIPADQFGTTDQQRAAILGPLYGNLRGYKGTVEDFNTATDEQVVPTRGGDWKDGDNWKRRHQHTWSPTVDNDFFNGLWNFIYGGAVGINRQLEGQTNQGLISELRAFRAFYHFLALDNFGSAPIVDKYSTDLPKQATRKELYDFVEKELIAVLPTLSKTVGGAYYGRFNQATANVILAKLYLNAEVYTGTAQWAKCVAACDAVTGSAGLSLMSNYADNFIVNNQTSPETVFAIPFDKSAGTGFVLQMKTLHYLSQNTYKLGNAPWNGFCTLAEFYNKFDDKDVRKQATWLAGQQFTAEGQPILDDGQPLIFTPEISAFEMPAGAPGRRAGVRCDKWQFEVGNPRADMSNDYALFRLADILLMRGEANFRLGKTADALVDINKIRVRAGVPAFTALTLPVILDERGRELAWEGWRRQDQIRFGTWDDAWQFKEVSPASRALFPIPQRQLDGNPNLKQNPGY